MKKGLLALLAVIGLVAFDASARARNCNSCQTCPKVCRTIEQDIPQAPCCVKAVEVRKPADLTKHVSYSWSCPTDCNSEYTMGSGQSMPAIN